MTAQPSISADVDPLPSPLSLTEWVTDAELIRRSGVPIRVMRANLRTMDANPLMGFPPKDPLWGGRRHWPSVQEYWKDRAKKTIEARQRRMVVPLKGGKA